MAKTAKTYVAHVSVKKKTTIGHKHSMIGFGTMNKSKRRSYKKYRGQGK